MFNFRYHGNYVGPGWSGGRYQSSVARSKVKPIDEFDETGRQHDRAYALKNDLKVADYKFYRQNIGRGVKRTVAALAVGAQGFLRPAKRSRFGFVKPEQSFSENEKQAPMYTPKRKGRGFTIMTPRKTPTIRSKMETQRIRRRLFQEQIKRRAAKKTALVLVPKLKAKRSRSLGAAGSTSSGKFNRARGSVNVLDYYAKKGVVVHREKGGVLLGSAAAKAQTVLLMHTTFGASQIYNDCAYAMSKLVAEMLGFTIESFSDLITAAGSRTLVLQLVYQAAINTSFTDTFNITNGIPWQNMANWFIAHWNSHARTTTQYQMKELIVGEIGVGTTPAVDGTILSKRDLSRARVQMYAKSSMKVQNRTLSDTAGGEADDVDNVPLYGKQYDGTGNFAVVAKDVYIFPANTQFANVYESTNIAAQEGLSEPPPLSQVRRAKSIGKAHLDPGQIKTSVLTSSVSSNINWLFKKIARSTTDTNGNTLFLGKFRIYILEKMIQAIATTDNNSIKLAYEVDLKVGVKCYAPKPTSTLLVSNLDPL